MKPVARVVLLAGLGLCVGSHVRADNDAAARRAACERNLRELAAAIRTFEAINDGRAPASLSELYQAGLVSSLGVFRCPSSPHGALLASTIDANSDYRLFETRKSGDPLVVEREERHGGGKLLAIYADDAIRAVAATPAAVADRAANEERRAPPTPPAATNSPPPIVADDDPLASAVRLAAVGRHAEALPLFDRVLARDAANREALWHRAISRAWANKLGGSVEDLDALLRLDPANAEVRRLRTLTALAAQRDLAGARATAQELARTYPANAAILLLAGQAEWLHGNTAGAQYYFQQARSLDSSLFNAIYQQAGHFLQAGVPAMAYLQFNTAVWLDQTQAGAYYGVGMAAAQLGAPYKQRAIEAFEQYLRFDSQSSFAAEARKRLAELRR